MPGPGFHSASVLVLGGGGILGEAWMNALLAGLEDASSFEARECELFVGTSAGSIVAAALAGGVDPRARLGTLPEQPPIEAGAQAGNGSGALGRVVGVARGVGAVPVSIALRTSVPGGAYVRRAALARVPRGRRTLAGLGRELDKLGVEFDGRLQVSAVQLESGRRVMFGAPGAPTAAVGEAVEASCAIPGFFRPVRIGGRSYVDGGAWSPTNMDGLSLRRGTGVLCLNPTGSMRPSRGSPFGALGPVSRAIAAVEALSLERHGARVTTASPDAGSAAAMGSNLMDARPRSRVIAAGYEQGRALASGRG